MGNEDVYNVLMDYLHEQFKVPRSYDKKLEKPIPATTYYPARTHMPARVPLVFTTTIDGEEYVVDNIKVIYNSDPENNS